MTRVLTGTDTLRKLFAALAEHTFQVEYGVADPPLVDYLSDMLVRFVKIDAIFHVRNLVGKRLEEVAEMLAEANEREGHPRREVYRHIGDFTLFWTGVYPEGLKRLKAWDRQDAAIDYREQGKRSYYIASTYDDEPYRAESAVLRRLSEQFELCSDGLRSVRQEWDRLASGGSPC